MEPTEKTTWLETTAGQNLQKNLTDQNILNGINHLLQRIDTLEQAVEGLTTMIKLGPGMISMATDMVDEGIKDARENGVDIEQRLGNALAIAEKLTAPAMVEKLDNLLKLVDLAPGMIAMTMDIADEEMNKAPAKNIDVKTLLEMAVQISASVKKANEGPHEKVGGIFSMLRTMRDPDRQVAIGYLMTIVKAWGQELNK